MQRQDSDELAFSMTVFTLQERGCRTIPAPKDPAQSSGKPGCFSPKLKTRTPWEHSGPHSGTSSFRQLFLTLLKCWPSLPLTHSHCSANSEHLSPKPEFLGFRSWRCHPFPMQLCGSYLVNLHPNVLIHQMSMMTAPISQTWVRLRRVNIKKMLRTWTRIVSTQHTSHAVVGTAAPTCQIPCETRSPLKVGNFFCLLLWSQHPAQSMVHKRLKMFYKWMNKANPVGNAGLYTAWLGDGYLTDSSTAMFWKRAECQRAGTLAREKLSNLRMARREWALQQKRLALKLTNWVVLSTSISSWASVWPSVCLNKGRNY